MISNNWYGQSITAMKISILGCGWFGTGLSKSLRAKGHIVKGSTTSEGKRDDTRTHLIRLETAEDSEIEPDFFDCEYLIVANNVRMKDEQMYLKRISYTIKLIRQYRIPKVIFISSTSVYGDPKQTVYEQTTPLPETTSAKLLHGAEQLFQTAGFDCTILRFAGLIGPGRDPGRFFAGKSGIPNGLSPVNLLHLDDAVGITSQVIESAAGNLMINAVSPDHPAKMDFYTAAAKRTGLTAPAFIPELSGWKIVNSLYTGYAYQHKSLS